MARHLRSPGRTGGGDETPGSSSPGETLFLIGAYTIGKERLLLGPPAPGSDRESELASPGAASVASLASSVRSELTDAGKSEEGDTDKLSCQFPGCLRTFDRPTLLKRHLKVHSGECR